MDFFLWGYLKDRIFQDDSKTILELKQKVTDVIDATDESMLRRVFLNKIKRVNCLGVNGSAFEHLL